MKYFTFLILCFFYTVVSAQNITRLESLQSLYVEVYKDDLKIGSATAFIIKSKTTYYLVTNYHVVTNKNPFNNNWLDTSHPFSPNTIKIVQNANQLGNYILKTEPLIDKQNHHLWFENKIKNEMVDVVELPLKDTTDVTFFPVNYETSAYDSVIISPTDRIFILGFPLGLRSSPFLPIWKSGLIASEPDFDQDGKPIMWVDAITYPGMSGSPVYFTSSETITLTSGRRAFVSGSSKFMGVFASANAFNVYGVLWKASYLRTIFNKLP